MNFLYFACCDCKIYIDPGYRWAYSELEQVNIVSRGQEVIVEAVLSAEKYWSPPRDAETLWLYEEVFPPLRQFLHEHGSHRIVFGELDDFLREADAINWMQVGYAMMPTPRYLAEILGFRSWDQVREYMGKLQIQPAWWEVTWNDDPSPHEKGRRKFEELVREKNGSNDQSPAT